MKIATATYLITTLIAFALIIYGFKSANGPSILMGFAALSWIANLAGHRVQERNPH